MKCNGFSILLVFLLVKYSGFQFILCLVADLLLNIFFLSGGVLRVFERRGAIQPQSTLCGKIFSSVSLKKGLYFEIRLGFRNFRLKNDVFFKKGGCFTFNQFQVLWLSSKKLKKRVCTWNLSSFSGRISALKY